mgnify:CR=1 FL=1
MHRQLLSISVYQYGWKIDSTCTGLYGASLKAGEWRTDYRWYAQRGNSSASGSGCVLLTAYDFETAGYEDNQGNTTDRDADGNNIVTTCNFYGARKQTGKTIYYYNEQADGSFKLAETVTSSSGGTLTIHPKYAGYTLYKYATGKQSGDPTQASWWTNKSNVSDGKTTQSDTVYIAHMLLSYSLQYSVEGQGIIKTESVKYTAPLTSYASLEPTRPADVPANFTFDGWYKAATCEGEKFDFTGTMPRNNLIVYGKWVPPTVSGFAHARMEDTTDPKEMDIAYGGKIDPDQLPTPSAPDNSGDWVFKGWCTRDENGRYWPFNLDTELFDDITLYPYYINTRALHVYYDANGGTGTAPTDTKTYAQGAYADVQSAKGLTAPAGKPCFLGWNTAEDGMGTMYYPGGKIEVKTEIRLYAIWGEKVPTVTLIYHDNYPGSAETKDHGEAIRNNDRVQLLGSRTFDRPGYTLRYWGTEANGGTLYEPAGWARVNKDGLLQVSDSNHLYAVWEANTDTPYTVAFYYQNNDGTYPATPYETKSYKGTTDTTATVSESDKQSNRGEAYIFDGAAENVLSGTVTADGQLVLKVYFKLNNASYTIHHYLVGTTEKVADDQNGIQTIGTKLSASAAAKDKLYADYKDATATNESLAQTITISTSGNVITVYYTVPLTLTAGNREWPYDGQAHRWDEFTVSGLVNNDDAAKIELSMKEESKITNVGTKANVIDPDSVKYNKDKLPPYYAVSYVDGLLEVKPATDEVVVTIVGNTKTETYDGTEKTVSEFKADAGASEGAERGFDYARAARQRIESNWRKGVTASTIAKELGVTPDHLTRLFKAETGCTVYGYLQSVRMEHAKEALALTDTPVAQIAADNGFPTPSAFAATFSRA